MKKYSVEARELLSSIELYDIKAGTGGPSTGETPQQPPMVCGVICTTCVGCTTSCTACTSTMMDVIVVP